MLTVALHELQGCSCNQSLKDAAGPQGFSANAISVSKSSHFIKPCATLSQCHIALAASVECCHATCFLMLL